MSLISIKGLHKFFNKGRQNEIHVINDISLELPERGMVAVFGKSGCGKTTLLNVIGGLDRFSEGSLTIEGQNIRENTDVIRNRYIGYIFQNYNLNKEVSCFDNVADALRLCGMKDEDEIETRVTAALTNVGMEKYAKRTPDTLSGGQQQRIAIARAIVKNPRIILADEPTGNLDEANTVMIMDLLKAIARDHLVLLVTHEANLVDFYCDTVIELSDGKIIGTKQNESANGFAARDKNDIWLGELAHREFSDENADIEYYGDKPEVPIKLKIVNNGGKIYLRIDTEKVHLLDEFSEVKLREGVYEEKTHQNSVSKNIDMSKLPPVKGERHGHLFSLGTSVKSGYNANFKNSKKGKKLLRRCMCLFSAVIVLMSAIFGTAFADITQARDSYNHNVFYIYTPDEKISSKLADAVGSAESGIDLIRLAAGYPNGDSEISFRTGSFETFESSGYQSAFGTNAVYLDLSLTGDLELVEGKKDGLGDGEMLITTKVADALIERSTLGYISERDDLIGLVSMNGSIGGSNPRIVGIVESDESAVYLSRTALAKYALSQSSVSNVALASEYGYDIAEGEAMLITVEKHNGSILPALYETIKIQGRDIKVTSIRNAYYNYDDYIAAHKIKKLDEMSFFTELLLKEEPSLVEGTPKFNSALAEITDERYYEYFDYYYSEIDAFYKDYYFFEPGNIDIWLYLEKGVEAAKFTFLPEEYSKAVGYKKLYGEYPSNSALMSQYDKIPSAYEDIKNNYSMYESEFYSQNRYNSLGSTAYLVSDEDYIAFSKQLGETHKSAKRSDGAIFGDIIIEPAVDEIVTYEAKSSVSYKSDMMYFSDLYYTVIHSNDPEKTAAWLESEFAELEAPNEYWKALITPDAKFHEIIESRMGGIITSLITMAVILVLMSLCMYFIMRSSLMNRIKEVGIYRAIGVSRKNLVFKFFIEACVLATLSVFIGYICTSIFISICLGASSLVAQIFYYPFWLAAVIFIILYAISLFFGTLPITSLLRKSPSEILAKYDI